MGRELKTIAISKIIDSSGQIRMVSVNDSDEDKLGDIQSLKESIKKDGLIQPILVQPVDDGKYELIAGHRRVLAHKLLRKTEIVAIVVTGMDAEKVLVAAAVENIERQNLSIIEKAIGFKRLMELKDFQTQKEFAEFIGLSHKNVNSIMKNLELDEEIVED